MQNSQTRPDRSLIIWLILAMCFGRLLYSTTLPPKQQPLDGAKVKEIEKEQQDRLMETVQRHRITGSPQLGPIPRKLEKILRKAPHDKPWHEVGDYIIKQAKNSFLDEQAPASNSEITLVSAVFNLGPDGYELDLTEDNAIVNNFFKHPQKKIVFVSEDMLAGLSEQELPEDTKIVTLDVDKMRSYLGPAFTDIETIQNNRNWRFQVGWLASSPQAEFPEFNMLGMCKVFLLREAARLNPFETESFLWFDPSLNCVSPSKLTKDKMGIFNDNFDRFFLSFFDYQADTETHGFPRHTMDYFLGDRTGEHKVVKGWWFGGRAEHIEVVAALVDIVMRETLRQGQMGNADCVLTIVMQRFPEVVHPFNLRTACGSSTQYDHGCPGKPNPHYWCSPFEWALRGPPS